VKLFLSLQLLQKLVLKKRGLKKIVKKEEKGF
jgi:hypothetical protein